MSSTESDKPKKKFSPEDIAKLKALKAEASATKNDIADLKAYVMEMEGQFKQQSTFYLLTTLFFN